MPVIGQFFRSVLMFVRTFSGVDIMAAIVISGISRMGSRIIDDLRN